MIGGSLQGDLGVLGPRPSFVMARQAAADHVGEHDGRLGGDAPRIGGSSRKIGLACSLLGVREFAGVVVGHGDETLGIGDERCELQLFCLAGDFDGEFTAGRVAARECECARPGQSRALVREL